MTHLILPNGRGDTAIRPPDPICMTSQQVPNQTVGSPMLCASAGSQIVLLYQENGHITLPDNTPGKDTPGQVFIYGTSQSLPNDTCKLSTRFGTLRALVVMDEADFWCSVTLTTAHVISQMGVHISQQRQQEYTPDRFKDRIDGVEIRCKFRPTSRKAYTLYTGYGIGRRLLGRREHQRERVKSTQLVLI